MTSALPLRVNKEYFGYIAGFSDGTVALLKPSAGSSLASGASYEQLLELGLLLEDLEVREGFYLHTPLLVWIELTRRCNLTCKHCYISGGDARASEMDTGQFRSLLDELADMGVWAVAFTGGEPTLHPSFVELVWHARQRGLLVGIATNGLTLSRELLGALPTDDVIISVSLDNLHFAGKQEGREFKHITEAIDRCHEFGFKTNIMTNTNRKNFGELGRLIDWAEQKNVSIRSVPFSPLGRGKQYRKELELSVAEADAAAAFWIRECELEHRYHKDVGLCVGSIFNYGLSLGYMTRRCSSGRYLAYIAADGTVYPCTMTAGESILSPGSILAGGFAKLWRSDWQIRQYSWDNFAETCARCPINAEEFYCAARCPAMSFARHGEYFSCGASEFEIASTVVRTARLGVTETGQSSGRRIIDIVPEGKRARETDI
ncbi:radical SAM protein [Burkholderia sp. JP2-270]|uniref:radical SAM/SPASM domain-containing protein n=1 Tax=Burkholderia sp. JP2-270 TaxID=2217913 RepID=UPI000DA4060C|nr:radical SAM protein [Burkholderia sp. JP2-270]AWV04790.1 radical SAM protein [Burkholderia sp. JP2-270]